MTKTAAQIARELRDAAWSPEPPAERLILIELATILDPRRLPARGELAAPSGHDGRMA